MPDLDDQIQAVSERIRDAQDALRALEAQRGELIRQKERTVEERRRVVPDREGS